MKNLLPLILFCLLPTFCLAQVPAGRYDNIAFDASGSVAPGQQITVCNAGAMGIPCAPAIPTFTDSTLITQCPTTPNDSVTQLGSATCTASSDSYGRFGFWIAPGQYTYTVGTSGGGGATYTITVAAISTFSQGAPPPSAATVTSSHSLTYNVIAFGADPTDSRDSTTAFQTAITAAAGQPVYVPSGTYQIKQSLTYHTNGNVAGLKLYGDGPNQTILSVQSSFTGASVFDIQGVASTGHLNQFQQNGYLREFTIQPASTAPAGVSGISIEGYWLSRIEDVQISKMDGDGIVFPARYDLSTDPDNWASSALLIEDCNIVGNGGWGINMAAGQAVNGIRISHSLIEENALGGIRDTGWNNRIELNSIASNGCNQGAALSVACTTNPAGPGILIDRPDTLYGASTTQGAIERNELDSNFGGHIWAWSMRGLTIWGNRFLSHDNVWINPEGLGANVPRVSLLLGGIADQATGSFVSQNLQRSDNSNEPFYDNNTDGEVASATLADSSAVQNYIAVNQMGPIGEYNNSANEVFAAGGAGAYGPLETADGQLTGVNLIQPGWGYTASPTVIVAGGDSGITSTASGTATVSSGQVTAVSVPIGTMGSNYSNPPLVGFYDEYGVGAGAAGTATMATGVVTGVTVTSAGSGYIPPLSVLISGGGGSGAMATATPNGSGGVLAVTVTNIGSGYSSLPSVVVSGTGGSGMGAVTPATIASGPVSEIYVARQGTGYSSASPPSITFSTGGGPGSGASAIPVITAGGLLTSILLTSPGSGYTSPPSVNIPPPTSGVTAAATALISGYVVTGVNMTHPGSGYTDAAHTVVSFSPQCSTQPSVTIPSTEGVANVSMSTNSGGTSYTSAPTITFTGGGEGSGGAATAVISAVGTVNVTSAGSGYTSPPAVTFTTTGSGTGAAATATLNSSGGVGSVVVTSGGSGYSTSSPPTVTFTGGGGTMSAVASAVVSGIGALNLTSFGSGYTSAPVITISGGGGTGAAAIASPPSMGGLMGLSMVSGGSGYTSAPNVMFGGWGTGVVSNGNVIGVNMIAKGGYTSAPTPVFTGGGGTGAAGSAAIVYTLGVPSITSAGSGCLTSPAAPLRMLILPQSYPSTNTYKNLIIDKNQTVSISSPVIGNLQLDAAGTVNLRSPSASTLELKGGPLDAAGNPGSGSSAGLDTYIYKTEDDSGDYQRFHIYANAASSVFGFYVEQGGTGTAQNMSIGTTGASAIDFLTNNTAKLAIDTSGNFEPTSSGVGSSQLGTANFPFFKLCTGNTAGTNTMCDAAPAFTGNRTRTWQDSSGIVAWMSQLPLPGTLTGWDNSSTAIAANSCVTTPSVSVANVSNAMAIVVSPSTNPGTGLTWNAYFTSGTDVVVEVCNITASSITPMTANYNIRAIQ